MDRKAL
jgi:hypothetical protein